MKRLFHLTIDVQPQTSWYKTSTICYAPRFMGQEFKRGTAGWHVSAPQCLGPQLTA